LIIAIDGPAAAGKGTLARQIADHFGFAYLDTGSLYRAVACKVLRAGGNPADPATAEAAARALAAADLADPDLRGEAAGAAASVVASIPAVRANLLNYQRNFAHNPPFGARGAVLDGRDIGTVVCPEAAIKLYVTARPEVRARRRFLELEARGSPKSFAEVLADLGERDARDSGRAAAPLRPAPDAYLLDTSDLAIELAFAAAKAYITQRL